MRYRRISDDHAGVMELADVSDSKSDGSDTVPVRPRSPAYNNLIRTDSYVESVRIFVFCGSTSYARVTQNMILF